MHIKCWRVSSPLLDLSEMGHSRVYVNTRFLAKRRFASDFFSCNVGVRQGGNLSPFLFSMYINDLEQYLIERNIIGLQSIPDPIEGELCVLFYADYTIIILAETPDDLQIALNEFCLYCEQCKLNVNISKTKILVFSKGRMLKKEILFNNIVLENVKEFKYLGIVFSRSGSFRKAKKHLCEQAQKAMFGVIRKIREFNLYLSTASWIYLINL